MFISSFFDYPKHQPGRISIARSTPRGDSGFKVYRPLNPGSWFHTVDYEEYRKRYFQEILGPLDPRKTYDELLALVHPYEPVLLCWEKRKDLELKKVFCHREMVAEWFEVTIGLKVIEWSPEEPTPRTDDQTGSLF